MASPLPPQIITTILDHLLPPRPPLPPQLLSKALTDRLIFLPPGRGDADSYLTPTPSTSTLSNPIATALEDLSHGYTVGRTFYAHDGESTLAKITIDPEFNSTSNASDTDQSGGKRTPLTIMFIHESQWKYHTTTPSPPSHLSWSSDPAEVITPPEISNEPNEQSVEDYWRGFSPKGNSMDLQDDPEGDGEDAYWAAYGGGTGTGGEPSRNPSFANFDHLTAKSFSTISPAQPDKTGNGGDRRVMCDMPTNNGALDPLAALLATIPDSIPASTSAKPSRGSTDLRDKVQGRIKGSLIDLWGMFTGGENLSGAMAEEKALGWIRLARGVVDRSPSVGGTTQEEMIIRAKMEVLRDMWEVTLDTEDDIDGSFWRCVEGVIRMGVEPDPEGEGMTQETYWE